MSLDEFENLFAAKKAKYNATGKWELLAIETELDLINYMEKK